MEIASAQIWSTVSGVKSHPRCFPFPVTCTGQKRLFPVTSRRNPPSEFVLPTITHSLGWLSTVVPYDCLYLSSVRVTKDFTVSTSTFLIPASSPNSKSQYPWSFSAAVFPSFISEIVRESEYHSFPSFAKNVDLPHPCGPFKTNTESNFIPGS